MSSRLESLPNELLQKILIFAADDVQELLSAELTSHALQRVVQDDETWKYLVLSPGFLSYTYKEDNRLVSNRQKACVYSALVAVVMERQKEFDSTRPNTLIDELGADGWRDFVTSVLVHMGASPTIFPSSFVFRGDALFVLAELVHDHMIRSFAKANDVAIEFGEETDQYPMVTGRFLERFGHEQLLRELETIRWSDRNGYLDDEDASYRAARGILADKDTLRTRIIRRLSLRAGVIRMNADAFDFAWIALVHMIYLLVKPACLNVYDNNFDVRDQEPEERRVKKRRVLPVHQTIREVAPFSFWELVDGEEEITYTVVPKQIEDAALSVFGNLAPHKVYGNFWVCCDEQEGSHEWFEARNQAIADAEDEYEVVEGEDMTELLMTPLWSDEEEFNLSDDESGDEWTDDDLASQEDQSLVDEEADGPADANGDISNGEREHAEIADALRGEDGDGDTDVLEEVEDGGDDE